MFSRQVQGRTATVTLSTLAIVTALLLSGCSGAPYSCDMNHCYGTVAWSGAATGFSMELTAVPLTSGDNFIDDEGWLIDYFASGDPTKGAYWVETGEANDGAGTEYFWAENKAYWGYMQYDLGPVSQHDLNHATWIAYKVEQDSKTPSSWNVTISDAKSGSVLFTGQSTENSMSPNNVTEGQELAGHQGAQAPIALFSENAIINGKKMTFQTSDGASTVNEPPNAGWFPGNKKPSQTTNGGTWFTDCC